MLLSLCMIVKDEEESLARCLQSVTDIVDEMVVVDTGSRDRTIAIARDHGATVHERPWPHDFALARNDALQFVQGDWVLVLDADEVLLSDCIPQMQKLIQAPELIAITLLRQEVGAQQTPYSLVSRLFRRHPQLHFERPYHESIDDSAIALIAQDPRWKIGSLPIPAIAHEGYRPEAIAARQKTQRATQIMGQYLATHPTDAYICSKLGALYVSEGRSTEGIALLEQGLQQAQDPATRYELQFHLGLAYAQIGQTSLARQRYEAALKTDLPDLLKLATFVNLAALYIDQGAIDQDAIDLAEPLLKKALQLQPDWAIAYYNLGLLHKALGRLPEAIAAYQKAIQLQPHSPAAYQNLGVVYLKLGQIPAALTSFSKAIALYQESSPAEAAQLQHKLQELGWITQ
ncbi:MAG: glycosyltransferase [Thermosynechococcaceae cyanobacterium MS004]|nr:glycosyltransferase [Thermosynechococcaceae cyanobacterium MS004]